MQDDPVKVVFRKWKPPYNSILALFPELPYDRQGLLCVSYEHVGQHGGADYAGCVWETKPASPTEYEPLKKELESLGYNLTVRRRHGR